jgi:hypothetical protein
VFFSFSFGDWPHNGTPQPDLKNTNPNTSTDFRDRVTPNTLNPRGSLQSYGRSRYCFQHAGELLADKLAVP